MNVEPSRCPSAKCREGAELLGIVRSDGTIAYLGRRTTLDEQFVRIAATGRAPEKRFRFSDLCVEERCAQWAGGRCGIIDDVIQRLTPVPLGGPLPRCSIRATCRWFGQSGPRACAVCPFVITDLRVTTADPDVPGAAAVPPGEES